MKFFPESALTQLEFDRVRALLKEHGRTAYAKAKAENLRIHTQKQYIELELQQSQEARLLLQSSQYPPNDFTLNISGDLKLLAIPGAVLTAEQVSAIRHLTESAGSIFRWFDAERRLAYPGLARVLDDTYYEKAILELINDVLDEVGDIRDNASEDLARIRLNLYKKRVEVRRLFDRIVQKWARGGYVADIEESFLNGRRVIAIHAEYKRQVKGILLGESDTRKTAFVEPEETIGLNNEVFALENEERHEVHRILRQLTASLSVYAPLLQHYYELLGEFDFIRAKGKLAVDINGNYPVLSEKAHIHLVEAYHPLLYLYNRKAGKPTVPTSLTLGDRNRILVISGPNAGGKTVTLKTVGLLQLMLQSGLLVPVNPLSEFGIFKQLMIHIGDTQSLEFELSTYSSHLKNMKHLVENANGRTLFFIDELGSGSDPSLGGAFAEVILEELVKKHALGIVTTHYLNLKVMAGKTPGIINGAMAFDEEHLLPLYKLNIGKPGSSYTFSIAERIGLERRLIDRARSLVDEGNFRLDKLLNRAEQELQELEKKEKELQRLVRDNERLKKVMETELNNERHRRQVELLQHQNKVTDEKVTYLKDMERKLKQIVVAWRKSESDKDRKELMKQMQALLFRQHQQQATEKKQKKLNSHYEETGAQVQVGSKVLMPKNHQVGEVKEIRGKKAVVQVGLIPITVSLSDLVAVAEKVVE